MEAIKQIAARLKEMRLISGKTEAEMAALINVSTELYIEYENGEKDFPFSFLHECADVFGIDITSLITGEDSNLSSFSIVRKGEGRTLEREKGYSYRHLAPFFKGRLSEPLFVNIAHHGNEDDMPIPVSAHKGEEFDYVLSGRLRVRVDGHEDILNPGDTIYYNSGRPHGMLPYGGDCEFIAVVIDDEGKNYEYGAEYSISTISDITEDNDLPTPFVNAISGLCCDKFIICDEHSDGRLKSVSFQNEDSFNFAFDTIDAIAEKNPDKLALLHISDDKTERRFTFKDMSVLSSKAANFFISLGIKKGDRVLAVMKRHWEFWPVFIALHKIGAIIIPATNQLLKKDFEYRINAAGVSALICTATGDTAREAEKAFSSCPTLRTKISVEGHIDGWIPLENFEYCSGEFERTADSACGNDIALMFFTSGTTGYPKIAMHSHKYALGHFCTAKYWHCVDPNGLHLTVSDTGWAKAMWGKMYGQWLCEAALFVYDMDRFSAADLLPMIGKYGVTTFCAPPTIYRMLIREDITKYDLTSLKHITTAGEALNPEVSHQFYQSTGLRIMEGFGQTETTLIVGTLVGTEPRLGSMGKPTPLYRIKIIVEEENGPREAKTGETGEIVIDMRDGYHPCGLFMGYYSDSSEDHTDHSVTDYVFRDGYYHTGDTAWKDEEGYLWFVGRTDDIIKSSGYRIGPFEIESVIMELPFVLECAITGVPDPVRGQVVKATIVPVKGTVVSDDLKKTVQEYVKTHTAPYKYPRIVEFVDELPKTTSGKIRRVALRENDEK